MSLKYSERKVMTLKKKIDFLLMLYQWGTSKVFNFLFVIIAAKYKRKKKRAFESRLIIAAFA